MVETIFEKIIRKSGRKPTDCKCNVCKSQCQKTPCLATPDDIKKIIAAGYGHRLSLTIWASGMYMGLTDRPVNIIAPTYDDFKEACTFFTNGLCELHEKGLKPTEGKLSNHEMKVDNVDAKKSVSWQVVKEWFEVSEEEQEEMLAPENLNKHKKQLK